MNLFGRCLSSWSSLVLGTFPFDDPEEEEENEAREGARTFNGQRSTFNVQRSTFNAQLATANGQVATGPTFGRIGLVPGQLHTSHEPAGGAAVEDSRSSRARVTQIFNLLYRRFVACTVPTPSRRHSRLQACATTLILGLLTIPISAVPLSAQAPSSSPAPPLRPIVEIEEDVYSFKPADNGAGPMWCSGSTCLVRVGEDIFASGLETLPDAKPLNNCRWLFFKRGSTGWIQLQADPAGRTREPCPLVAFPDSRIFLSANPTLVPSRDTYSGPARPEILQFSVTTPQAPVATNQPVWDGNPAFTEHSYRSFAGDGPNRELILFQNIGYTHAEWAFRDRDGNWAARGKLVWPWGAEYDKPQPIRVCYPDVALRNRAVHFCGVSDILEPYQVWRDYKKKVTEIASRDKTCGWVSPGDLWAAPDGTVHIVWTERAIDERLREKFFPGEKQRHSMNYALVREGKVVMRHTLAEAEEGGSEEIPSLARFHVTPGNRLFVFYYVSGRATSGQAVSKNRIMEISADGSAGAPVRVPLQHPLTSYFTATVRAGSAPSETLDLLGHRAGQPLTLSYARVRLRPEKP
jgi:hypothetical protein